MQHLHQGGKAIAAIWHQRILIVLNYAGRFGEFAPAVMISQSRDGEMIADVYRRLNFRPVRGSSSARRPEGSRRNDRRPCGTSLRRPCRGRPPRPPGGRQGGSHQHGPALRRPDRAGCRLRNPGLGPQKLGPLPDPETLQHGLRPLGYADSRTRLSGRYRIRATPRGGRNNSCGRCRTIPTGNAAGPNPSSDPLLIAPAQKHSRTFDIFHGSSWKYPLFNKDAWPTDDYRPIPVYFIVLL